jgi:hypothetical protein
MQIDANVGGINQSAIETVQVRPPKPEAATALPVDGVGSRPQSNPNNPADAGQSLDMMV